MRRSAIRRAFILAALLGPATASQIDPVAIRPRIVRDSPLVLEFEIPAQFQSRWVRLRQAPGRITVNGTLAAPRPADRVTSTVALSPYLNIGKTNRIEVEESRGGPPEIELLPRVFLAGAAAGPGGLRILIENTLDNAANIQVEVAGAGHRDAYVPPESQFEVEWPFVPEPSAWIRLTKFAEAVEEGYSSGAPLSSLAKMELRRPSNGAMVLGIEPDGRLFQILERPHGGARPSERDDSRFVREMAFRDSRGALWLSNRNPYNRD
jgi:hypothetical protein